MNIVNRSELESPKTANDMTSLIHQYLNPNSSCAISDDVFYSRKNRTIKALIEEYVPLATYLTKISINCTPMAYLFALSSHADGIIDWGTRCEKIQIVHGTADHSEALKREVLNNGKIVATNSTYVRDQKTKLPVEDNDCTSHSQLATLYTSKIIKQIEIKVKKGYCDIDTLLIGYNQLTYYKLIEDKLEQWINSKSKSELKPFSRIVLADDCQHVKYWDI